VTVVKSGPDASAHLASIVSDAANAAIICRGFFTLVLSGGSLPQYLSSLCNLNNINWSKVYIFFVDERNVPYDSPDSSYKLVREHLLSKIPIPGSNVFSITEGLSVLEAAVDYNSRLHSLPPSVLPRIPASSVNSSLSSPSALIEVPSFDLTLLGVGPDGHVASLFPGSSQLLDPETHAQVAGMFAEPKKEEKCNPRSIWVLPVSDSPKPPSERITLTMPVINGSKEVIIVSLGAGKADIIRDALEGFEPAPKVTPGSPQPLLPVQWVRSMNGPVRWILDEGAAAKLKGLSRAT